MHSYQLSRFYDGEGRTRLLAWVVVLVASFANFLAHNRFPLLTWDALAATMIVALIALVFASLHNAVPRRFSYLMTALLVMLAIDLNTQNKTLMVVGFIAAIALAGWKERLALTLAQSAFAVVLAFQLFAAQWLPVRAPALPLASAGTPRADLPPLVHIVLDAYLGMDGMAQDSKRFGALRQANLALFEKHGFRVYGAAYSEHRNTANSIPAILSFGTSPLSSASQRDEREALDPLPFFSTLKNRGYQLHVLHSQYLDFCTNQPIASCSTFNWGDLAALRASDMNLPERAETMTSAFFSLGLAPRLLQYGWIRLRGAVGLPQPVALSEQGKVAPLASMQATERLIPALRQVRPGQAVFVHLLMPHGPYALDANCHVTPRSQWQYEASGAVEPRDRAYIAQSYCVLDRLDRMLTALDSSPNGRKAVVILHGDHGSRIAATIPELGRPGNPTTRDYAMSFSTLFAIKSPQVAAGYDAHAAPVSHLLRDFTRADFAAAPATQPAKRAIILADTDWVPRKEAPLPEFGSFR